MNVHVLGSDYPSVGAKIAISEQLGVDVDWGGIFTEVAKDVSKTAASYVSQRLSPTQKSIIQNVTGTSSSIPNPLPPKKTFMEENGMYIMIGGAILVGAIILMKTRRRTVPVA